MSLYQTAIDCMLIQSEQQLCDLLPLLSASYGGDVDWADEREYFLTQAPRDWVYAKAGDTPVGFVRHFACTTQLHEAELYLSAPYRDQEEKLLQFFHHHLLHQGEMRFCLPASAKTRLVLYQHRGYQLTQTFRVYRFSEPMSKQNPHQVRLADAIDIPLLLEILGHFGNLGESQLRSAIQEQRVFASYQNEIPCAVAYLQDKADGLEILELATHPRVRRQGFASILLYGLASHFSEAKKGLYLKVDTANTSAVALYEKTGLTRDTAAEECWLIQSCSGR